MARIVVTGGAGFLGSHLCDALLARGDEVVCIDNLVTGDAANVEHLFGREGFTFVRHDVSSYVWVPGTVDVVMHLASPASPVDYLELPIQTLKVGSLGTHNLLGLAKAKGATFFLASTSEVYGDPQVHPQPETYWGHVNPVGPRGVYDEAKRFAEAMTLAYHRHHGLDVRIVRIFNSVLADEHVLYDDGSVLRHEPVGELAHRVGDRASLSGYSVPAFGKDGVVRATEAIALEGHPPGGRCYEVRTRYGRSIRVTGDHSLFTCSRDGRPVATPVSALRAGDHVAIAGRVDVPERDRRFVRMIEAWIETGGSPWDLIVRHPSLGDLVWRRRFELFDALTKYRKPDSKVWRSVIWGEISRHRQRQQLPFGAMRALGIPVPLEATVRLRTSGRSPELPALVHLSDELLWAFGLFVAEGCRYERGDDAFFNISCDPDTLDRAQKVLERELGLHVVRSAGSRSRSAALFAHSKVALRLLDYLGFRERRIPGWVLGLPLRRLKWFIEGYREGDGVHSGKKLAAGVRHEFSTVSALLRDDLVVALARFGIVASVGTYETTFKQRPGDRRFPFHRVTVSNVSPWSPLEWDRGIRQRLNARRTGDLVWAMVTEICEIAPTTRVYDFSVPGRENFWAGRGIMAHNTYGERMRPNDGRVVSNFVVQALQGKPLTVYGDGSQTRSFCYVADEIRGFLALLDGDTTGPVNIGNPDEFTVAELAGIVLDLTGSPSEVVYEPLPVDDPTQRRPDITLARTLLGWEPTVPLRDGLARTIDWFRGRV